MEETEERAIVQGKLDYFLTNQTLQVPSSINTKAKQSDDTAMENKMLQMRNFLYFYFSQK